MLFGHSAKPWENTIKEIELVAEMGLDFVEIVIEPPVADASLVMLNADKIRDVLKKHGIHAYGHAPSFISLGSSEVIERASSVLNVQRSIDACACIGAEKLVVHSSNPGFAMMSPKERERALKTMADSFSFLCDYAKKQRVQIMAENTSESPQEFFSFLKRVDGLKMTFDIGHAFIAGKMNFIKTFLKNADSMEHMHAHDNHGDGDEHLALGKGKINVKEFASELRKAKYDKSITLEIFSGNRKEGVKSSVEMIKKEVSL